MAAKYTARQDFETFKTGESITVAQAGDNAEAWLRDGLIAESGSDEAQDAKDQAVADAPPPAPVVATPPTAPAVQTPDSDGSTVTIAEADGPAPPVRPASTFATLNAGPDASGVPSFATVEPKRQQG